MSSNVKNDVVYANYQSNTSTFIKEIIGEMKYQFNKSEHKNEVSKTENNEVREISMDDNQIEEKVAEKRNTPDVTCEVLNPNHSVETDDICDLNIESSLFKRPSDEVLYNTKGPSPSKRSLRQKGDIVKTTIKRSLRCRGKNSSESILQSAIARKEKSYNESNKPQRLSRQKKLTKRNLDIKEPQVEKDKQSDNSDDTSSNPGGLKILSSEKKLKKIKRQNSNSKDELESDSLDSTSGDTEYLKIIKQNVHNIKECDNKEDSENVTSQNNLIVHSGLKSELMVSSSAEFQLISSRLCLCTQKTNLFADVKEKEPIYCTAIDSIEEKLVGCSRIADVKTIPLLRPSRRVPYQIMCDFHKNRLIRHNCCPTCGIFCTQGRFVECKAKHQYHRKCQISVGTKECCPHCGISSPSTDVFIKMHCDKKPIFLPTQKPN